MPNVDLHVRDVERIQKTIYAGEVTYSGEVVINFETELGRLTFTVPFSGQSTIDAGIDDALKTFEALAQELKDATAAERASR